MNPSNYPTNSTRLTPDYIQTITANLEQIISIRDQREAQAAAAASADATPEQAPQTATESDEAAPTEQQPELALPNWDADANYPIVDRHLRNTFTEVHHGLRNKKDTWKAWHSVPNYKWSDIGQRLILQLASRQTTPAATPKQASAPQSAEATRTYRWL